MKSIRLLLAVSLLGFLLFGCTTTGKNTELESAVQAAQTTANEARDIALRAEQKADQAMATANQALSAANGAQSTADQALKEAREAKALSRDAAAQSERMYEKSMTK